MATITTVSNGSMKNSPRREYIATAAFNNDFYTYTTTLNPTTFVTTGALSPVTTNAAQTPAGRTLRENGRKLYPGANPGITTYMVGVYDDQTGLKGYINPNSAVFAIFNTDKPTYLTDGSEISGGTYSGQNQGNSLYTRGTVTAGASVTAGPGGFIMPSATVAAAGANQANAAALVPGFSLVTGANGSLGVRLPAASAGLTCVIKNNAAGGLLVYPATGDAINAITANSALTMGNLTSATFVAYDSTTWYTIPLLPS